jgi:hypothetical protein
MASREGKVFVEVVTQKRKFEQHPPGKFALCLKGNGPKIPDGTLCVDLPGKISRVLSRVELGAGPQKKPRLCLT